MADKNWAEYCYISDHKAEQISATSHWWGNYGASAFPITLDGSFTAVVVNYNRAFGIPGSKDADGPCVISDVPFPGYQFIQYTNYGIFYYYPWYDKASSIGGPMQVGNPLAPHLSDKYLNIMDILDPNSGLYEYLSTILSPSAEIPYPHYKCYKDDTHYFLFDGLTNYIVFDSPVPNASASIGIRVQEIVDSTNVIGIFLDKKTNGFCHCIFTKTQATVSSPAEFIGKFGNVYAYKSPWALNYDAGGGMCGQTHTNDATFLNSVLPLEFMNDWAEIKEGSTTIDLIDRLLNYVPMHNDFMDLNIPGNSEQPNAIYQFIKPKAGLAYSTPQTIEIDWNITGATKNPLVNKKTVFTIPANAHCFVLFTGKYIGVYCNVPGVTMKMDVYNNTSLIGTVTKQSTGGVLEVQDLFGMYEGYEPVGGIYNVRIKTPFIFIRQIYRCGSRDELPQKGDPTYEIFQPGTSSAYVNPNNTGELAATHLLSFNDIHSMKVASDADRKS